MTAVFDYKSFAKNLTKQAESSMPDDIALSHKKEFLDRIYNFTYIAGEAFSKDENIENSDTKKMLTQIISEWTFHKYVDLLRSDIPAMYHESILQKLGYVAFEMTRESTLGNLSKDEMLKLVEIQLKKSFEKFIFFQKVHLSFFFLTQCFNLLCRRSENHFGKNKSHKQDRDCPIHLPDCPRKLEPVNLRHHDVGDDQLIEIIVHLIISFPYVQTSFHLKSAVT